MVVILPLSSVPMPNTDLPTAIVGGASSGPGARPHVPPSLMPQGRVLIALLTLPSSLHHHIGTQPHEAIPHSAHMT